MELYGKLTPKFPIEHFVVTTQLQGVPRYKSILLLKFYFFLMQFVILSFHNQKIYFDLNRKLVYLCDFQNKTLQEMFALDCLEKAET
jgi:hypothetical protein